MSDITPSEYAVLVKFAWGRTLVADGDKSFWWAGSLFLGKALEADIEAVNSLASRYGEWIRGIASGELAEEFRAAAKEAGVLGVAQ